jgi:hypothetical protein
MNPNSDRKQSPTHQNLFHNNHVNFRKGITKKSLSMMRIFFSIFTCHCEVRIGVSLNQSVCLRAEDFKYPLHQSKRLV